MSQTTGPHQHSFFHALKHHALPLAAVIAIVLGLEWLGFLAPLEAVGIDRLVRIYAMPVSTSIFIVEITDDDYRGAFGNRSPLKGDVLEHLIGNIRQASPKVIGIDLDTSDTTLPGVADAREIVWAEVPEDRPEGGREDRFVMTPVLKTVTDERKMGVIQFPADEDGIVRRFQDAFLVRRHDKSDDKGVPVPSLSCAVAARYDPQVDCGNTRGIHRFSFAGNRYQYQIVSAGEILSDDATAPWRVKKLLGGSIVLVGGRYRAARDEYVTPAGAMAGVEVIANAAQSYLPGGRGIRDAPWWASIPFDVFIGGFAVWLYWKFSVRRAFWLSVTAAPLLALAVSYLAFRLTSFWLSFMPVLAGMILHEMYDHAKLIGKMSGTR